MNVLKSLRILLQNKIPAATVAALSLIAMLAGDASAIVINFNPAVAVGDFEEFAISPDGTQIAFVGSLDEPPNGPNTVDDQAWVAPIGGGTAVKINPDGVGDVDGGIAWTPDGLNVVIRYEEDINDPTLENELYLAPANGSQAVTMLTSGRVNAYDQQVSADGNSLFFSDTKELYVTSFPGAGDPPQPATLLKPTVPMLVGPDLLQFDRSEIDTGSYAQVGSDIIFSGFSTPVLGASNGTPEDAFYRTAADGSTAATPTPILISNFPDPVNDFVGDIDFMAVTPDQQTIIFRGDLTTDGVDELYSLPIAGGIATPLLPSNTDIDLDAGFFKISPDGTKIAFAGDLNTNGVNELYVIPITGGTPLVANDPLGLPGSDVGSGVDKISFSPDSQFIYYHADAITDGTFELFRVSANPVPEPSSVLLLMSAVGVLGLRRRSLGS